MHAILINQFGGPDVLQLTDLPTPVPQGHDVLVQNHAIGVNFVDTQHRAGTPYPITLPLIPGIEGAGVVQAVGPAVTEFHLGDRVAYAGHMGGDYAESCLIPESRLIPLPDHVDFTTAAAILLQGMTAHALTESVYPIRAGDTVLIHAAGGGVGLALVQMAKQRGATVIGTVSSQAKADLARQFGADHLILYTTQNFETETQRLTSGQGVHAIYDGIGRTTFAQNINLLRAKGYLVLYGLTGGDIPPFDVNRLSGLTGTGNRGSLFLTFATLSDYGASREDYLWRAHDVLTWCAEGKLKPHIAATLPLAQAARAHQMLEDRQVAGKLILLP